jgi:hypothetical protein
MTITETITEKHDKILRLAEEYTANKLGLRLTQQNDLNKYLNLTPDDIRRMSYEECGEASYILAASTVYIQLELNRITADINWCERALNFILAKELEQFGGSKYTPYEQRKLLIIGSNEAAAKLNELIVNARVRLDSANFLPAQIKNVMTAINNIQQSKRHYNG